MPDRGVRRHRQALYAERTFDLLVPEMPEVTEAGTTLRRERDNLLRHSGMRLLAQARNPYSRSWLWIPGALRFASRPGMTAVRCECAFPRRECVRVLISSPSIGQRAQGMPGARCTRGLIRKWRRARMSIRAQRRHPASPAQRLYGLCRALPGDEFV